MAILIKPGDTLGAIARQYKLTTKALLAMNPNIKDPNKIQAGAKLNVPTSGAVGAMAGATAGRKSAVSPALAGAAAGAIQPKIPKVNRGATGTWEDPQIEPPSRTLDYSSDRTINDGSLSGTMTQQQQQPTQPFQQQQPTQQPPTQPQERQLPGQQQQGSMAAFQDVLQQIGYGMYQGNKPSVSDVVDQYMEKGVSLVNPETIRGAYTSQADLYARPIGSTYQSTMNLMQEKMTMDAKAEEDRMQRDQAYSERLMDALPKSLFASMSKEEFEQLQTGQLTPELQNKIMQAQYTEESTGTKAPTTKQFGETYRQWNAQTGQWDDMGFDTTSQADLDKKTKEQGVVNAQANALQEKLNQLDIMATNKGKDAAIGTFWFNRLDPLWVNKTQKNVFLGTVEQFIDQSTINELLDLKRAGGTLGQITEKELDMLRSAANKMNNWIRRDENGKIESIEISEKEFMKEMNTLKEGTLDVMVKMYDFDGVNDLKNVYNSFGADESFEDAAKGYDNMLDFVKDVKRMEQPQQGFNQDLSMSQKDSQVGQKMAMAYKPGQKGGQCGDFTHNLVDFPPMGNYFTTKKKKVDQYGIKQKDWSPKVGDVVISDGSDVTASGNPIKWGHASVVTNIDPNGQLILTESNRRGDEKVTTGRTISKDSAAIYGAFRGKIKKRFLS